MVTVPREVRFARLAARGMPVDEAERRMAAQTDDAERIARADVVVDNGGARTALDGAVERALRDLGRDASA